MKSMLPQADFLVAWERAVSVPAGSGAREEGCVSTGGKEVPESVVSVPGGKE